MTLRTALAYMQEHRRGTAPFDVNLGGVTPGDASSAAEMHLRIHQGSTEALKRPFSSGLGAPAFRRFWRCLRPTNTPMSSVRRSRLLGSMLTGSKLISQRWS